MSNKKENEQIAQAIDPNEEARRILEEAQKKAAAIVAEAEAKAKETVEAAEAAAQTPNVGAAPTTDPNDELVPIRLFKDNDKYKDDVFVAVNGESIQIKRGETVMVKRKFARVLEQSEQQDTSTANLIEQESKTFALEAEKRGL